MNEKRLFRIVAILSWVVLCSRPSTSAAGEALPDLSFTDGMLSAESMVLPVGDTLTVIQRPLLNIPAIVLPLDTLPIECAADPATTGWTASLIRGTTEIPLSIVSSAYDPTTLWWTVSAVVPAVPLYDLYDLVVDAGGVDPDTTRHAVKVVSDYKDDYYFVQISDTHLPAHRYYYESGWEGDSTEVEDLRALIDDFRTINPEFVLLTGDLVNEGELEDYLDARYYTRSQKLLAEFDAPVYLVAGNHDLGGWDDTPPPDGTARRDWWRFFGWKRLDDPPPGAPWYTQNYDFHYGPVHYIGLEAYINYDNWRPSIYGSDSFRQAQLDWLEDRIAASPGSISRVLFYHIDFSSQIDLNDLGVDMALWGHIHRSEGSIASPPYDLAIDNACDGARAFRLVRVSNGVVTPEAPLSSGSSGQNLSVSFTPANDGTNLSVQAEITNNMGEPFENGLVRFVMPKEGGSAEVAGGTLLQVDRTGPFDVYQVAVSIQASGTQPVTLTLDPADVAVDGGGGNPVPPALFLGPSRPNPFNPETALSFDLPRPCRASVVVYDLRGRLVRVLLPEAPLTAGRHEVRWSGDDRSGAEAPSGVYLIRLRAAGETLTRKAVLAR